MSRLQILRRAKAAGVSAREAWETILNPIDPAQYDPRMPVYLIRGCLKLALLQVYGAEAAAVVRS